MTTLIPDGRLTGRNLRGVGGGCVPVSFIAGDKNIYAVDDEAYLRDFTSGRTLFLVDTAISDHTATHELIKRFGGAKPIVLPLQGGEPLKDIGTINELQKQVHHHFLHPPNTIFAIGGGTLINTVNALVPLLSISPSTIDWKGRPLIRPELVATRNYVVVPTTILSVADVAYGSKGNLNDAGQKHAYKLYYNPSAIFLDPRYVDGLPASEIKAGLVECLKHALLQDQGRPQYAPSFTQVSNALMQRRPDSQESYHLACQTMYAKSAILGTDDREQSWRGILLSYGHLHAHAYEMASGYKVSHGEAVLLGMLIDQKLAGSPKIYDQLLTVAAKHTLAEKVPMLQALDPAQLQDAYRREPKSFFRTDDGRYKVLAVNRIGAYGIPSNGTQEDIKIFNWGDISGARQTVLSQIVAKATLNPLVTPFRHLMQRARDRLVTPHQ